MPITVIEQLKKGFATSKEIQIATGLNQKAVSRQIRALGDRAIRLRKGRTHMYAVTCDAFGSDDKLPLFFVDAHGNTEIVAIVHPLAHGGFFVREVPGTPNLLLGERQNGLYEDLPYFLADLCPQGFIGRQIANDMSERSKDFPSDPRYWNSNHIGMYLTSNGDDLPGNIKFGAQMNLRHRQKPFELSRDEYPDLADSAINGDIAGSSAGGEQPKFTIFNKERGSHVLVKFSPEGDSDVAKRWRDILITEHYATLALQGIELPTAETMLIEKGQRLFLESNRFDRMGKFGRSSMVSLQSVDAEFVASDGTWLNSVEGLHAQGLIGVYHYYDVRTLSLFGKFINNTDMHLGNLSLSIDGDVFRLCPIYDMCSMGFAPKSNGEVRPYEFSLPQVNEDEKLFSKAKKAARAFWNSVANEPLISEEFRSFLASNNPADSL